MGKKKTDYREFADVAASYGLSRIDDYGVFCGLWINLPRIRFQRAAEFMLGYGAATTTKSLDPMFFDGLARFEEDADVLAFEVNAARSTQATLNKMGMR